LQGVQALQQARAGITQVGAADRLQAGAHFDLAALEARLQQLAQGGLVLAQVVGEAKGQVQEAAVDGADLDPQARSCGRRISLTGLVRRATGLGAGIAGHAEHWHLYTLVLF
jgi:hypothetical protein